MPDIETEARRLFEADPSSDYEAEWDYLVPYKKYGWLRAAETARTRNAQTIRTALASVYGDNLTVTVLADHLAANLSTYEQGAVTADDTVEHQIHMAIWNWFPGGSTALLAAQRIIDAVYLGQEPVDA